MTRETKVGLLVGMGVILLIGIIVSDHLAVMQQERREARDASEFADRAQRSIEETVPDAARGQRDREQQRRHAPDRREPPTADHDRRDRERWAPDLVPSPRLAPSPDDRMADQHRMPPVTALDNLERGQAGATAAPASQDDEPYQRLAQAEPAPGHELEAAVAEPEPSEPEPIVHRVERGETLYDIARKYYGDGDYWRTIAEQNAGRIIDGEHVREGIELTIPDRAGMAQRHDGGTTLRRVAEQAEQAMQRRGGDGERTITVVAGDTLSGLASEHLGSSARWRDLLEANRDQLDSDRDLRAGMTLRLPGSGAVAAQRAGQAERVTTSAARTYVIRRGDTLTRIAEQKLGDGNRWRELFEANEAKLDTPDALPVGEEIQIPS